MAEDRHRIRSWHYGIGVLMLIVSAVIAGVTIAFPTAAFNLPIQTDFGGSIVTLFLLPTTWVLFAATLINGIVHLYYAASKGRWREYYRAVLDERDTFKHRMARHVNYIRWCLYGIFLSLLVWVVAQHAGIGNIFLLFAFVALNVAIQRTALHLEIANHYAEKTENVDLYPFVFGLIYWAVIWIPILVYFFASVAPAWWTYVIVIGAAVAYIAFGVVALLRYMRIEKWWKYDVNIEIVYIILEIVITVLIVVPALIGGIVLA